MKKLLRLTVAALLLATSQVSTAQIKMAPNYFRADPAVYKIQNGESCGVERYRRRTNYTLLYDKMGCLLRKNTKEVRVL